ncbi:bis(5'-nucleosyl)-tetraphosphatase (symmetrical) YqeK [Fictibacillus nanhaiensis]|uniref:bis(5'-nucleosyl)-tetraphosphatase (symmetrical) YqeK n=1 Tax=Fictibacillus nanhaiensis TaxID=742169 RepID=UPI001C983FC1|nr:bis(5'-nucleosyl)-tetraphosphatase (symmetrical) YqeK [Fictibacillus nanhaiensis]MBY6035408.1 bis(5'-nucleosyl)-tetraphosphatase (symmetrical) YqeK [Fictibacillus nanhaiensis]
MDRAIALQLVKKQLTEHRYVHTLGVMESSLRLAAQYGADLKKAELAAIFHDYAKFRPKEEMKQVVIDESLPLDLLDFGNELLHAPVGSILVKREAGIHDKEILSAIYYHTTGNGRMSQLEKIVFLADYIEPNRQFPGVEEVRDAAERNLNEACLLAVKNTVQFLMKQNQKIYPLTIETYNGLQEEIRRKK